MGWDLDRTLAFWTAAGIDHVGVPFAKLEAAGGDAAVARVAERVAERGLTVGNLIGPGSFRLDDRGSWPAQQDRFRWIVDAAAVLQAGCVVFTTGRAGGLTWEQAADALEDALDPVVAHAADRGVALALEHTNSLRPDIGFVHRLRDAVDLARRLGIGVCMETNACWLERALDDTVVDGYVVDERVQWENARPGIERIVFIKRLPLLSHEEFADHWLTRHTPLARRHHPGMCRYVQNLVTGTVTPGAPEVDGIAELGFASRADMEQRMYDSPRGRDVI